MLYEVITPWVLPLFVMVSDGIFPEPERVNPVTDADDEVAVHVNVVPGTFVSKTTGDDEVPEQMVCSITLRNNFV